MPSPVMAVENEQSSELTSKVTEIQLENSFFRNFNGILEKYKLIGLNAEQVKAVLGEPFPVSKFVLTPNTALDTVYELPEHESLFYRIPSIGRFKALRIHLQRFEVIGWSVFCGGSSSPMVRANVTLKLDRFQNPVYKEGFGISYPETTSDFKVLVTQQIIKGIKTPIRESGSNPLGLALWAKGVKVLTRKEFLNGDVGLYYDLQLPPPKYSKYPKGLEYE
ncbi:MAG: hypothetical protein KIT34_12830 [Cyanobacteria bacterium TGS_CYA1]|nr:hypothetical protein [Cyanobacteria bacterium TGS_CYA1]